jgi:hypothetical protein
MIGNGMPNPTDAVILRRPRTARASKDGSAESLWSYQNPIISNFVNVTWALMRAAVARCQEV